MEFHRQGPCQPSFHRAHRGVVRQPGQTNPPPTGKLGNVNLQRQSAATLSHFCDKQDAAPSLHFRNSRRRTLEQLGVSCVYEYEAKFSHIFSAF